MTRNKQLFAIYLFLTVTTLAAFLPVGNHEFVNFDDDDYITENRPIQNGLTIQGLYWAFTTGHSANWHPVTWISHMMDIQIFGLNPGWHHLTNLLFHLANVLLLFFVLHRMTKARLQSAFVAALFALHPLHVESVAWVSERKDVLSTFFWMLTLVAYAYYSERPRLRSYLAIVAFFALGLMAKPMLVTLPFVLLLLDYWPLERFAPKKRAQPIPAEVNSPVSTGRKKEKRQKHAPSITLEMQKPAGNRLQWALIRPLVLEKIPLFVLTALSCAATCIAQRTAGAVAPLEIYTPAIRIANAFVSYLVYIAKTIWPDNLAVLYPHPGIWPLWQVLGAALFLAGVTFAVIRTAKQSPFLPVGWLWFTGTLVPVIGIVQVGGQAMADRYTYIPSIGLFVMAAWGIPQIFKKWRYGKEVLASASVLCLLFLFFLTWRQVGYWHDSMTLFDHALGVTKDNFFIYNNRGMTYYEHGDYKRAIEDFDRAVQSNPGFATAYNNRGNARNNLGDYARAIEDFDRAIQIDPLYAQAFGNRGNAYNATGNYTRGIQDIARAIEIDPEYAKAYNNLGAAFARTGNREKALDSFNRALEINPYYADAHYNRGFLYQTLGEYRKAIDDYDSAIKNHTGHVVEVLCGRGVAYERLGDRGRAIEDYSGAIEINPRYANAYLNRGVTYLELGDHLRAVKDFDRVLELNPAHAGAYYQRGKANALLGNQTQALEDMKTAARLGSEDAGKLLKNQGID